MAKVFKYDGAEMDVFWHSKLCIHIGECGRADGDLFVAKRKPWCQPDLVGVEATAEVIERCPTGALSYVRQDGVAESPPPENTITIANNGPLYVHGDLDIADATDEMPGVATRAALCRCGLSKNKPFCDNSHEPQGFRDHGAIGAIGDGLEETGGPLTIRRIPDGPLHVKGNVTLVAGSGRMAWGGTEVWLCRCGQSKNKPFCDGSHTAAGFTDD